jgi:tRNA modification GTPase
LNPSPDPLEKLGMEKTIERLAEADLCLWVLDASGRANQGPPTPPSNLPREGLIVVFNKMDLASAPPPAPAVGQAATVLVSARSGSGMGELVAAISSRADAFQTQIGGDSIAINARHAQALTDAREGLGRALAKLGAAGPTELLASDLRSVLSAFEQIIGKVDNERMLDQLFRSFCIGK